MIPGTHEASLTEECPVQSLDHTEGHPGVDFGLAAGTPAAALSAHERRAGCRGRAAQGISRSAAEATQREERRHADPYAYTYSDALTG